jgi:prepilin-type N-terminal cleavage/methylation domain-containing protein
MTQDGYTLTEMLVALVVIGLAIGGMTEGLHVISRLQGSTGQALAQGRAFNGISQSLSNLFEDQGPFASSQAGLFSGDASGFSFRCARKDPCGAVLIPTRDGLGMRLAEPDGTNRTVRLSGVPAARFTYAGTYTFGPAWPSQSRQPQTLRTVGLVAVTASGEIPLASVRLWQEQAPNCEFDAITRACRGQPG